MLSANLQQVARGEALIPVTTYRVNTDQRDRAGGKWPPGRAPDRRQGSGCKVSAGMIPLALRGDGSALEIERLRQQLVGSDAGLEIVGDGQDNEPVHAGLRAQLQETVSHLFRRAGVRRWQLCWRMANS